MTMSCPLSPKKNGIGVVLVVSLILLAMFNFQIDSYDVHHPSKGTTTISKMVADVMNDEKTTTHAALKWMKESMFSNDNAINNGEGEDCFCPSGRPNWIYYTNCPGNGAGMKDRQNILRNVLWWADELCAKVALKCSPGIFLGKQHGCFAPETATWDDYFVTRRDVVETGVLTYIPLVNRSNKFDVNTIIVSNLRSSWPAHLTPPKDSIVGTTGVQGYEQARELYYAQNGTTFLWQFDISFWDSDLYTEHIFKKSREEILPHRPYTTDCRKIDFYPTKLHIAVAQILLDSMNMTYIEQFATLHLRRGDYRECDTDPETVMRYLKCSLPGGFARPGSNGNSTIDTLLAFTNGEPNYKANFTRVFEKTYSREAKIIFVDDVIVSDAFLSRLDGAEGTTQLSANVGERILQDNCYSWQIMKVIIALSKTHLERGHMSCNQCDVGGVNPAKIVVR